MTLKTKRKYEKPAMQAYKFMSAPQLLAGSGLNAPNDYPIGGDPFNF